MKTINFKEFAIFPSLTTTEPVVQDVRETIADGIYQTAAGVAGHSLAMSIFKSDGAITLDDKEYDVLTGFFAEHTKAWMYASLEKNVKEGKDDE